MVLRVREDAEGEERFICGVDTIRLVCPWSVDRGVGGQRREGVCVAGEVGAERIALGALELGRLRYREGEEGY